VPAGLFGAAIAVVARIRRRGAGNRAGTRADRRTGEQRACAVPGYAAATRVVLPVSRRGARARHAWRTGLIWQLAPHFTIMVPAKENEQGGTIGLMRGKKLLLLLFAIALALALVACGGEQTPEATSTPEPASTYSTKGAVEGVLGGHSEPTPQAELAPRNEAAELFSDDFDGFLDSGWTWKREDPSQWNLSDAPGFLRITLSPEAFASASNVLLHDAPGGDFEIATMLRFVPSSSFQFAGLIVYQDDLNALQFGRAFCRGLEVCLGDGIYFDNIRAGGLVGPNYATAAEGRAVAYLRLQRQGETYTAFYSEDGGNWSVIGQHTTDLTGVSVGLVASQASEAPAIADFDYFVLSGGETVASVPTATSRPTGAASPTPEASPTPAASPTLAATAAPTSTPAPSPTPLGPARRLATGTIVREAGARDGLGELSIENGRELDAVAVVSDQSDNPVIAVYIQSNDSFTISGLRDGSYQLYFSLGEDWDASSARFTRRAEFFRFEELLPFATTATEQGQQYTIFQVTLHAVTGGTAPVESLPEGKFPDL